MKLDLNGITLIQLMSVGDYSGNEAVLSKMIV
jgi:hypothetical protein